MKEDKVDPENSGFKALNDVWNGLMTEPQQRSMILEIYFENYSTLKQAHRAELIDGVSKNYLSGVQYLEQKLIPLLIKVPHPGAVQKCEALRTITLQYVQKLAHRSEIKLEPSGKMRTLLEKLKIHEQTDTLQQIGTPMYLFSIIGEIAQIAIERNTENPRD